MTLENIITNRIEFLNTDIFVTPSEAIARMKGKTAAGGDIEKINELADNQQTISSSLDAIKELMDWKVLKERRFNLWG